MPPQYIGKNAHVENSMITEGSVVDGTVDFSIISSGVTIEEGASVKYSIVMTGTTNKKNAIVEYHDLFRQACPSERNYFRKSVKAVA